LNFKISVHKIHYESAYVCKDEFPENDSVYINVKVDDEIFSSCPNNKFSLRYYFDKSCFNEALLMEGVKQFPHLALDSDLSGLRDYMVFIPVENELYLNQNFTSEGKIKIVGAPVSYKIEFCQ
jgi:hypothetical protein